MTTLTATHRQPSPPTPRRRGDGGLVHTIIGIVLSSP